MEICFCGRPHIYSNISDCKIYINKRRKCISFKAAADLYCTEVTIILKNISPLNISIQIFHYVKLWKAR